MTSCVHCSKPLTPEATVIYPRSGWKAHRRCVSAVSMAETDALLLSDKI